MYSVCELGQKNFVYYLCGFGIEMKLIVVQDYELCKWFWYLQVVQQGWEIWLLVYVDYCNKVIVGINLFKLIFVEDGSLFGVVNSSIGLQQLIDLLCQVFLSVQGVVFVMEMKGDMVVIFFDEFIYQVDENGGELLWFNVGQSKLLLVWQVFEEVQCYLGMYLFELDKLILLGLCSEGSKIEVVFCFYCDFVGLVWLFISVVLCLDFLGLVISGVYQMLMLGLMVVCLIFVIGFLLLCWVLCDICKLILVVKSIGNGSLFLVFNIDCNDEIGQLV